MYHSIILFAVNSYNNGVYNGSNYNGQVSGNSSVSQGLLTNTGFDLAVIITLASVLLIVAILVRAWKRSDKTKENSNED